MTIGHASAMDGGRPGSETRDSSSPESRSGIAPGSLAGILVFLGIFFAVLMGGMDALVVNTALPTIAVDLHQSDGIPFVVGAYLIASTVSIPIFACLSDSMSRRTIFIGGLLVFITGSMLAGLSQNLSELIAFRAVQGFGIGGLFPVAIAIVAVLFPPGVRARMTALLTGAAGISIVAGPLLGSYILDVTTWRWVFYINLPIGVASLLILVFGVSAMRPARSLRFDSVGAVLLAGWVAALMFPLVQVSDAGWAWSDPRVLGLLIAAGVLLAVFLAWEFRNPTPLLPLRLLSRRVVSTTSGVSLFNGLVLSSALTFLSVFVGIVLFHGGSNSANMVRDMIYFFAIPMITGAAISAPLLNRFSYRTVIAGGLALGALSCAFLTDLSTTTSLWVLALGFLPVGGLVAPLIPMGFGLGLALAGVVIAIQNEAPTEEVGSAVGLVRFFQSLGGAVGLSLLTAYAAGRISALSASVTSPAGYLDAIVTAYNEVFVALLAMLVIALGFALFLKGRLSSPPASVGQDRRAGSTAGTPVSSPEPPAE